MRRRLRAGCAIVALASAVIPTHAWADELGPSSAASEAPRPEDGLTYGEHAERPNEPYKPWSPHPAHRDFRENALLAGGITLGVSYALTVVVVVAASYRGDTRSVPAVIPVIGPFVEIGTLAGSGYFRGNGLSNLFSGLIVFPLVIDGLAQTTGFALLMAGAAAKPSDPREYTLNRAIRIGFSADRVVLEGRF